MRSPVKLRSIRTSCIIQFFGPNHRRRWRRFVRKQLGPTLLNIYVIVVFRLIEPTLSVAKLASHYMFQEIDVTKPARGAYFRVAPQQTLRVSMQSHVFLFVYKRRHDFEAGAHIPATMARTDRDTGGTTSVEHLAIWSKKFKKKISVWNHACSCVRLWYCISHI